MAFATITGVPVRAAARSGVCCARRARVPARAARMCLPAAAVAANPAALEVLGAAFRTLNMPAWLVEWGHPGMMGLMVLGMGVPGAAFGWAGRLNADKKAGLAQKSSHETIMVAFLLLAFLGGFGGTLSVVIQGYDIFETPHAKSAAAVLLALVANAVFAYSGFSAGDGSPKARLEGRKYHAYFGAATMAAFVLHAYLGVMVLMG